MAFLVPALAAVGGGSAVAGGLVVGGVASGVLSGLSALGQGEAAAQQARLQGIGFETQREARLAEQAGSEAQRIRQLRRDQAAQRARAVAGGLQPGVGTPETLQFAQAAEAFRAIDIERGRERVAQSILRANQFAARSQARSARLGGRLGLASGLFQGGVNALGIRAAAGEFGT